MKYRVSFLLLSLMVMLSSCVKRETIPDDELALIFRDAFLTNSYVLSQRVQFDSLQVYQPIFDKYGYSVEDVAYTVGSFSKRKSARLSDVVESAIEMLEEGEKYYKQEVLIIDSIEAKALRAATIRFYSKDKVEYYKLKDSTAITLLVDSLHPGKYHLTFDYNIDSLDDNRSSYRTMSWVGVPGTELKRGLATSYLRKNRDESFERTLTLDTLASEFHILLADTYEEKRKPHITFENINIDYTLPLDEAVDKFYRDKLNIRIFADDFFHIPSTDSLQLSPL